MGQALLLFERAKRLKGGPIVQLAYILLEGQASTLLHRELNEGPIAHT